MLPPTSSGADRSQRITRTTPRASLIVERTSLASGAGGSAVGQGSALGADNVPEMLRATACAVTA